MGKQMVADLRAGEPVDADFIVKESSLRATRQGSSYLAIRLGDRTGDISGRLWDAPTALAEAISADDFVHVKGKVESYRNALQIGIRAITQAEADTIHLSDFLPTSGQDPHKMMKELRAILDTIEDPDYKRLVDAFLADEAFCKDFRKAPAAKVNHHAYLGGLLDHTLSMLKLAVKIQEHYVELRRDLLLVGVFLHDIGKTEELVYDRACRYSTPGNLVGHLVLGLLMIQRKAEALGDFPEDKLNRLRHIVLSHHGEHAFGSPKLPMFAEAQALHYIDNMDAKLKDFSDIIAADRNADPEWTDWVRKFERPLYKK